MHDDGEKAVKNERNGGLNKLTAAGNANKLPSKVEEFNGKLLRKADDTPIFWPMSQNSETED